MLSLGTNKSFFRSIKLQLTLQFRLWWWTPLFHQQDGKKPHRLCSFSVSLSISLSFYVVALCMSCSFSLQYFCIILWLILNIACDITMQLYFPYCNVSFLTLPYPTQLSSWRFSWILQEEATTQSLVFFHLFNKYILSTQFGLIIQLNRKNTA